MSRRGQHLSAPRRMGLRARVIGYGAALVVVGAGCFVLWYRSYYNVWPGQDATARVHWCERDYQNDGGTPETWQHVMADTQGRVRGFGRYPPLGVPGQQLFAAPYPDAVSSSCTTVVYLRTGANRYQSYSLLGGP